ncbi:MAG: DUF4349 domain-containing protein [Chitinophagales bacterium]
MKSISKYLMLFVMVWLTGCHSASNERGFVTNELADISYNNAKQENVEANESTDLEEISRKLIKEGWVEFETKSIETTGQKLIALVEQYKGYVASDNVYKSTGRTTNTVTIRIPAETFDQVLEAAIQDVKKIDNKQINVRDVTEEFVDIEARLKTKRALETRYSELLQQAKSVSEILEIESELGSLRADIESIEGRLKYLQNQVSFSTLHLTFYETYASDIAFNRKFKEGFQNGWDNLFYFFVFLTNIWPFIVLGILFILGIRWYRRR